MPLIIYQPSIFLKKYEKLEELFIPLNVFASAPVSIIASFLYIPSIRKSTLHLEKYLLKTYYSILAKIFKSN